VNENVRAIRAEESKELYALNNEFQVATQHSDEREWTQAQRDDFADRMDAIHTKFQVRVDQFIDLGRDET